MVKRAVVVAILAAFTLLIAWYGGVGAFVFGSIATGKMNQLRTSVFVGRSRSDVYIELNSSKSAWHLAMDGLMYDPRADTRPVSLRPRHPDVVVVVTAGDTLFCHVQLVAQISFDSNDRVAEFGPAHRETKCM